MLKGFEKVKGILTPSPSTPYSNNMTKLFNIPMNGNLTQNSLYQNHNFYNKSFIITILIISGLR